MPESNSSGSSALTSVGLGNPPGQSAAAPAGAPPPGQQGDASAGAAAATSKAWWADFEADFKDEPSFEKIKAFADGPKGLVKSYVNLEKMMGGDRIAKPKSDDDVEAWERWYDAAGRPKTPEEYEFKRPDSLPDNFYSEDMEKSFRTWARENGLNKKQASNLYEGYVKTRLEQHMAWDKARHEGRTKAEEALKREFGPDGFQAAQGRTKAAYQKFADPEFAQYLDETGLGNDPRMIRIFDRIGKEMMGETQLRGQPSAIRSPQDIDADIAKFRLENREALYNANHPLHKHKVDQLFEMTTRRFADGA
jgi:hypothetical protein